MENFLWTQWKKPTDASRFVIDGIVSLYSDNDDQQKKVMDVLKKVTNFKSLCKYVDGYSLSPSLRYGKSRKGEYHCMEGNYNETDDAGRKLAYIFVTKEKVLEKQIEILKDYASKLNLTLNDSDITYIREKLRKKKLIDRIIIVALCLIIIVILSHLLSI